MEPLKVGFPSLNASPEGSKELKVPYSDLVGSPPLPSWPLKGNQLENQDP